jgi:hypothetical protein
MGMGCFSELNPNASIYLILGKSPAGEVRAGNYLKSATETKY